MDVYDILTLKNNKQIKEHDIALNTLTTNVGSINNKLNLMRFGYRINKNDLNPNTRVEYLYDAIGMTPAKMNYTSGVFEYGDWANIWFLKNNYPAMVKFDGKEDYRLNPDDYTKKIDGSASDVANLEYQGNAMGKMPLVWVNRYETTNFEYVVFCENQYDENYKAYAYTRENSAVMDYFWFPMFRGTLDSNNKLRSISGQQPMASKTAQQERDYAKANGTYWDAPTMSKWQLRNDLLRLISKSTDEQTAFGRGNDSGYNAGLPGNGVLLTGKLNNKGQFFGYNDGTNACKVMHSEVSWADQYLRVLGWLCKTGRNWVKPIPPYDFIGINYINTGVNSPGNNSWDYIKSSKCADWGRVPQISGASSATGECDGVYSNHALAVGVAHVGGYCYGGVQSGASCVGLNASASTATWVIGSAPFCEQPIL